MAMRATGMKVAEGHCITGVGRDQQLLYLVLIGMARGLIFTFDGRSSQICEYAAGDLIGELDVAVETTVPEEVIALTAMTLAALTRSAFADLAERCPSVALALCRAVLGQMARIKLRLHEQVTVTAMGRVYAELLRLAKDDGGHRIYPAPTVTQLAEGARTTRETASRAIAAAERRGLIERKGASWRLASLQRLQELVV
jgi:CRP-like cAMP-binding protein